MIDLPGRVKKTGTSQIIIGDLVLNGRPVGKKLAETAGIPANAGGVKIQTPHLMLAAKRHADVVMLLRQSVYFPAHLNPNISIPI
jgi:hypothetical protein